MRQKKLRQNQSRERKFWDKKEKKPNIRSHPAHSLGWSLATGAPRSVDDGGCTAQVGGDVSVEVVFIVTVDK